MEEQMLSKLLMSVFLLGIKMNPEQKCIQIASSQADKHFNVASIH